MPSPQFWMLGPGEGTILLPTLQEFIVPEGKAPISLEEADGIIRKADERLQKLNAELKSLQEQEIPDTERWNPYPKLDDDAETTAEKLENKIYEESEKRSLALKRSGRLLVELHDPQGDGPTPSQSAAIDYLLTHEKTFAGTIRKQAAKALENADDDRFEIADLAISRWDEGAAFIHVAIRSDAYDEYGLYVIYRQGHPACFATTDDAFEGVASDPKDREAWEARQSDPAYQLYDKAADAAMDGNLKKLQQLVSKGVNLNYPFEDGYSPLWHAIDSYHAEIVRFLLENGADPFRREEGKSALGTAREKFQELSWLEKPRGLIMKGAALFTKIAGKGDLATKELQSLREIIHMLEDRMGLKRTKF